MSDLLAQYRRDHAARPGAAGNENLPGQPPVPDTPGGYEAFGARDRVERVHLRAAMAPHRTPSYSSLLDIAHDGKHGSNFVLYYSFMSVAVRGKNLQTVVAALQAGTAWFLQEYDADEWPQKPAPAAPIIEQMAFIFHDQRVSIDKSKSTSARD